MLQLFQILLPLPSLLEEHLLAQNPLTIRRSRSNNINSALSVFHSYKQQEVQEPLTIKSGENWKQQGPKKIYLFVCFLRFSFEKKKFEEVHRRKGY